MGVPHRPSQVLTISLRYAQKTGCTSAIKSPISSNQNVPPSARPMSPARSSIPGCGKLELLQAKISSKDDLYLQRKAALMNVREDVKQVSKDHKTTEASRVALSLLRQGLQVAASIATMNFTSLMSVGATELTSDSRSLLRRTKRPSICMPARSHPSAAPSGNTPIKASHQAAPNIILRAFRIWWFGVLYHRCSERAHQTA